MTKLQTNVRMRKENEEWQNWPDRRRLTSVSVSPHLKYHADISRVSVSWDAAAAAG